MSTEHQQYSTANQDDVIREYATKRGFEIVRTYADEGKSGLRVEGRESLKHLIADVQSGAADFDAILVYDVSRWGRFQDADESAYYEYLMIEDRHGKNMLNLVIVVSYLKKLLDNARMVRYLSQNHPEILAEFQKLVEARNLPEPASEAG
jgi:DNA invertase Pin-like site-specific DNA recombinase